MAVWDLSISVEELGPEAPPLKISVTSDLHIGGVILKVVEKSREFLMSDLLKYVVFSFARGVRIVESKSSLYKQSQSQFSHNPVQ